MKRARNEIVKRKSCTGCGACRQICPKECISVTEDKMGFQYPEINQEKCVQCGLCRKVCPVRDKKAFRENTTYFAAYNKEFNSNDRSSSGGIFKLLAEYVLSLQGIVFGAMCDDNLDIHHGWIDKEQDIAKLQGSKYVQSDIRNSYCEAEHFLKSEKMVLFSGTPCQIAGLKSFLGKEYSNLICIDLVCHGVPSARLWRKYLQWHKETFGKIPMEVNFRDRSAGGWRWFFMKIKYNDGTVYCKRQDEDPFLRLFLQDIALRDSCYACEFKGVERQSDITLGDCWGIEKIIPEWKEIEGVSLLMVHSDKGAEILQKIQMASIEINKKDILRYNKNIICSVKKDSRRKKFSIALPENSIEMLADKYCKVTLADKVKYKFYVYYDQLRRRRFRRE